MKVIFLDFDGVLTSSKAWGVLDPGKMELLWRILKETGASIVISSSWREFDLKSTLNKLTGGKEDYKNTSMRWLDKVVGVTPRPFVDDFICYDEWNREEEIKKYLDEHPEIDNFIILDDMEDEFIDKQLIGRLVKTEMKNGLQEDNVVEAIKLLNESNE